MNLDDQFRIEGGTAIVPQYVLDALSAARNGSIHLENPLQWESCIKYVLWTQGHYNPNMDALVEIRPLDYKILGIETHPDDGAIAFGGTLSLLSDLGCNVRRVTLSIDEDVKLAPKRVQATLTESAIFGCESYIGMLKASQALRILTPATRREDIEWIFKEYNISLSNHLSDGFEYNMQQAVYKHLLEFEPDLVLAPGPTDNTADHVAANRGTRDAGRRPTNWWEYVGPEGISQFKPNHYVPIGIKHFARKMFALQKHQEAYYADRPAPDGRRSYFNISEQLTNAIHFGRQAMPDARYDAPLAEPFSIWHSVGLPMIKRANGVGIHGRPSPDAAQDPKTL